MKMRRSTVTSPTTDSMTAVAAFPFRNAVTSTASLRPGSMVSVESSGGLLSPSVPRRATRTVAGSFPKLARQLLSSPLLRTNRQDPPTAD